MTARLATLLSVLGAAALASCHKAAPTGPPAPAATAAPPAGPFVRIDGRQEYALRGTKLQFWDVTMARLKTLAVKLLVVRDGKAERVSEVEYKWDKWDAATPSATGRLVMLLQDGSEFGAPNRRLPSLAVDVKNTPPHAKSSVQSGVGIDGALHHRMTQAVNATSLGRSGGVYSQLLSPDPNEPKMVTLGSDLESAVAASKGGNTVLVVTLDWTPQD